MEPTNSLDQFYLKNCRKIFNKFLAINIGLRDVVLMGDDGTCIKCHRFVLSACSPFFERAFETFSKTKDDSDVVGESVLVFLLASYKSENVRRMVNYIYHGKLSVDLSEASDTDVDEDFVRLAKELKISGLHDLLIEKQQRRHTKFKTKIIEILEKDVKDIRCMNGSLSDKNIPETSNLEIVPKIISSPDDPFKLFPKDNIQSAKQHLPEALLKSLPPEESLKLLLKDSVEPKPKDSVGPEKLHLPEKLFQSFPEYKNWLRLLSNVRNRQAAKNLTLRDKKPQELLNDIIEGVKYCFLNYPNGEYECLANIKGHRFSGRASSQQAARLKCVKTILLQIFNISFDEPQASAIPESPSIPNNNNFGDIIERLILDKYRSLMINNVQYMGYKVIAGIVKSVDNDPTNLKVISIGTGSKFLYEKNLSSNGNAVHDTHAEVVARRGFIRYIYNQIGQSNSIFEKADDDGNGKFRLRPGTKFHLYVSTAPCGDARVRSHTNGVFSISTAVPEGQLRTKGQGALTVKKDSVPLENNCSVNMSCSAKLLRWNILGIQGAVLSELIQPIYLTSMVFGEKFNPIHMKRALFGRIETDSVDLPKGFQIIQPELIKVSATKAKAAPYSPNHSVNWNGQGFDVEILESTSGCTMGKDKTKLFSRISKRAFFREFIKVATKLNQPHEQKYADAKQNAKDYQTAKSTLFQIFENNGIGSWVQKRRRNLDDFTI